MGTSHLTDKQDMDGRCRTNNFIKLRYAIDSLGLKTERYLIQHHLHSSNASFHEFLTKNNHKLYHLFDNYPCCRCRGKPALLPRIRIVSQGQFELLFDTNGTRMSCHNSHRQSAKCCLPIKSDITLDDIDLSLARLLLRYCCIDLFWKFNLDKKGKNLEDFLEDNRHDIYHLWKINTRCIMCRNGYLFGEVKEPLHESEWNILYDIISPWRCPEQAFPRLDLSMYDITDDMAMIIFDRCCSLMNIIKKLHKYRNEMAHSISLNMTTEQFQSGLMFLEHELILAAKFCEKETEFKQELDSIKAKTITDVSPIPPAEPLGDTDDDIITRTYRQWDWDECQDNKIDLTLKVKGFKCDIDRTCVQFNCPRQGKATNEANSLEDDEGDVYHCGPCSEEFSKIEDFNNHRKLCEKRKKKKPKERKKEDKAKGVTAKITFHTSSPLLSDEVLEYGNRSRNERSTIDIELIAEFKGSLVFWTRISNTVMQTKETFLRHIEEFFNRFFHTFPNESLSKEVKLPVSVEIIASDDDSSEDDEGDFFRCGRCYETFFVFDVFKEHKKTPCLRSKQTDTLSPVCEKWELDIEAFKTVHTLRKKYISTDETFTRLFLPGLQKSVQTIVYKTSESDSIGILFGSNIPSEATAKVDCDVTEANCSAKIVMCILDATNGHLTDQDYQILHSIRNRSDFRLENTFFCTKIYFEGYRDLHVLSVEICKILKNNIRFIFPRIFSCRSEQFFKSVSSYLLRIAIRGDRIALKRYFDEIEQKKQYINDSKTKSNYVDFLENELLNENCKCILLRVARFYQWKDESCIRSELKVAEAREAIFRHVCEVFSRELVIRLIQRFESIDLKSDDYLFLNTFVKSIKSNIFEEELVASFQGVITGAVWDSLKEIFKIENASFCGVDVNDCSFREEIAEKMYTEIESKCTFIAYKIGGEFVDPIKRIIEDLQSRLMSSKARVVKVSHMQLEEVRFENIYVNTVMKRSADNLVKSRKTSEKKERHDGTDSINLMYSKLMKIF